MHSSSKNEIIRFQKYMKPSGCCQTCQAETQLTKDCIITCQICRSCIHQTHYGSELLQPPEVWQCQRCRYFLQNGPCDIGCYFCPSLRGIMKQYIYENQKRWLHPQCAAWGYPIIYFATSKKQVLKKQKPKFQSTYFWVPDYEENKNPCQVCKTMTGYRIKCKYYSCPKSYHVTCGRTEGIVRDLESMKIQNGAGYFPVYCKQHIELKIQDCKKRVKLYKQKGEHQKATHYHKIGNLFLGQLKNLQAAVKKCKLEQQMIKKMSLQTRRNIQTNQNVSFSELQQSFSSQQSNQFLRILQEQMIDEQLPLKPIDTIKIVANEPLMQPILIKHQFSSHPQEKPIVRPKNPPGRPHKHAKQMRIDNSQKNGTFHQNQQKSKMIESERCVQNQKSEPMINQQNQRRVNNTSYEQMFQNF